MNKKEEKDKKGHLSIQMNEKLNEYLDEFVKENGLKKSRLIEELLKRYVDSKSITDDDLKFVNNILDRIAQFGDGELEFETRDIERLCRLVLTLNHHILDYREIISSNEYE